MSPPVIWMTTRLIPKKDRISLPIRKETARRINP